MAKPAKAAATGAVQGTPAIKVRMYRQGLGDSFLLTVPDKDGKPFNILFDCGAILGTPQIATVLEQVLNDVIATTGGELDVLVVTHEHYDHVAAFSLLPEKFAQPGRSERGKLSVRSVWFAWTEDPDDELARTIRAQRQARKEALAGLAAAAEAMGVADAVPDGVLAALDFFGVARGGGSEAALGSTAKAMKNAAGFAPKDAVKYWNPGESWSSDTVPAVRVHVLGPPRDAKKMGKTDSTTEVYHLDADPLEDLVRMGADRDGGGKAFCPFENPYRRDLRDLEAGRSVGPLRDFLIENYWGPKPTTPEHDPSWRRIDGEWMASAEQLALALDSATNNTSLALAIEIVETGEVLLFPADAQVGNWLSWHDVKFDGFTTADLLSRTKFYKVGHHGSHNATLKAKGLDMMPAAGLIIFIPVVEAMAQKKRWFEMPLPHLVEALREHNPDGIVQMDKDLPPGLKEVTEGGKGPLGSLYYDWTHDISAAKPNGDPAQPARRTRRAGAA
ncbi:MAG TPA: hypothetical protein VE690_17635 [Rhodopila sp.]|jgi:hypothetical protein|nr:hypothetical protein [Rhodopila sp.]